MKITTKIGRLKKILRFPETMVPRVPMKSGRHGMKGPTGVKTMLFRAHISFTEKALPSIQDMPKDRTVIDLTWRDYKRSKRKYRSLIHKIMSNK